MEFLEVLDGNHGNQLTRQDNTQKIVQLRKQRDVLRLQLQSIEKLIIENKVTSEEDDPIETESEELETAKDQHEKLSNMLDCYRLTGFSIFSMEDDNIIFSFDTSHKGKSFETYYLELGTPPEHQNAKVIRHTFPPFVPVDDLEKAHLKEDPKQFMTRLQDFLFAYITRREEVSTVEEKFHGKVKVSCSKPFDSIDVKIGQSNDVLQLEFRLTFTDLLHTVPSKTSLVVTVNDDQQGHNIKPKKNVVTQWKQRLETELLSEAITHIVEDYSSLVSYCFDE